MSSTTAAQQVQDPIQYALANSRRRWEDLSLVVGIGFVPLVMSGIYQLFVPIEATTGLNNYRFWTGLVREIGILLLFAVLFRRQGRRFSEIGLSFQWLDLLRAAGLTVGSWLVYMFAGTSIGLVYFWSGSQPHYRDPEKIFGGTLPVLFLVYTIAAPFFEEILVRGYLMTELIGLSWPVWLATLASVALQTSYHLYYGIAGAIIVGATFLVSAIYFAKTRRLTPVILSHLAWDLAVIYLHWHH
jgi:membrane protease YdiL (CAAX protease family)